MRFEVAEVGMTRYLVPFSVMSRWIDRQPLTGAGDINLSYNDFNNFIRKLIGPVLVDEAWYCEMYPGISEAIGRRVFSSVYEHYIQHGYFEEKDPSPVDASDPNPLPRFSVIKSKIRIFPTVMGFRLIIEKDALLEIVRMFLSALRFDESWYRKFYPGIGEAIDMGVVSSGLAHFVKHGYFECRLPFEMDVDEEWYREAYPDVVPLITGGRVASARDHFLRFGYVEGCLPAQFC